MDYKVIFYGQSSPIELYTKDKESQRMIKEDYFAQLNKNGLLEFHRDEKTCNNCKYFKAYMENIKYIKALWYDGEYIWSYETSIPHTTFDIIEDGRKYCRGIIFNINNLKKYIWVYSYLFVQGRGEHPQWREGRDAFKINGITCKIRRFFWCREINRNSICSYCIKFWCQFC